MLPYQVQFKNENISERSPNKSDMSGILAEEKYPEENFTTTSGNLSQNIGYRPAHRVTIGYNTPPRMQILEHELENINDVIADVSKLSTTCKYFRGEVDVSSDNREDDFKISDKENSPIVPVASPKMLLSKRPQNLKKIYENVVSPVSTYIKSPGPFKLPMKPVKCSPIVQNNSRPPKNNYKNIASPVGTYIKYSSKAPLYQKVQNSPIQDPIKNSTCKKQSGDKENIKLPTVIYKPANFYIKYKTENEYNLPPSVKKLFTTNIETKKHEKKITKPLNAEDKEKQLQEGDLTVNGSINSSTEDISFLKCKENIM